MGGRHNGPRRGRPSQALDFPRRGYSSTSHTQQQQRYPGPYPRPRRPHPPDPPLDHHDRRVPPARRRAGAASQAGREHPCRMLAVISRGSHGQSRLDAEIRSGDGAPGQTVLMRLYGAMSLHPDSVVMPLLVPDTPVVTWWPGAAPEAPASEPLGRWPSGGSPTRRPGRTRRRSSRGWRRLPAGRHRPELDPLHGVAVPAGRHGGPDRHRHPRRRRAGRGGQPDGRAADRLADQWLRVPFSREVSGGPASPRSGSRSTAATSPSAGPTA